VSHRLRDWPVAVLLLCGTLLGPLSCTRARRAGVATPGVSGAAVRVDHVALVASAELGPLAAHRWKVDNGLEVITLRDPGATAASYVTYYRVGSRDEDAAGGGTGLAHLFEHLMFTQTHGAKVVDEFDRVMEEVGANTNAMTSQDFTVYVNDMPPAELARAVRLEADRMLNLDLRAEQVQRERDVVVEERLALVEDDVDGLLEEMLYQQAFREHPYRWPVIGRMDDIKAVTREKTAAFYERHYGPDRAVVVVAGRFEEPEVLEAIAGEYRKPGRSAGSSGRRPDRAAFARERAPVAEVRAVVERPVPADRFVVGYPAPALADRDRTAYEVLAELLVGGPSSRLYRLLVVEREIASSIRGQVAPTQDPGLWAIWVQMTKGHGAADAEALIVRELGRVVAEGVTPAELGAAQSRLETTFWQELRSSRGKAEALGEFEVVAGDFRVLLARGAAYRDVTADELREVARDYLAPGARSVVVAKPKEPEAPFAPPAEPGEAGPPPAKEGEPPSASKEAEAPSASREPELPSKRKEAGPPSRRKEAGLSASKEAGLSKAKEAGPSKAKEAGPSKAKQAGLSKRKEVGSSRRKEAEPSASKDAEPSKPKEAVVSTRKEVGRPSKRKEAGPTSKRKEAGPSKPVEAEPSKPAEAEPSKPAEAGPSKPAEAGPSKPAEAEPSKPAEAEP
jgi:zinc protease